MIRYLVLDGPPTLAVPCPWCGQKLRWSRELALPREARCPACRHLFPVEVVAGLTLGLGLTVKLEERQGAVAITVHRALDPILAQRTVVSLDALLSDPEMLGMMMEETARDWWRQPYDEDADYDEDEVTP